MGKILNPSEQVKISFDMGTLEGRVAIDDSTLKPRDMIDYLYNAEKVQTIADNKVLSYIVESGLIKKSRNLKRIYNNYKRKYWK